MKILYLTTGVFEKGGISRYNRYQITAFRNIVGNENVKVLSLHGPDDESFEKEIAVTWHGKKFNTWSKIQYMFHCLWQVLFWRPHIILIGHVNFSGMGLAFSKLIGAKTVLNVYGHEVWSGFSRDALWGLKGVQYVISDCHFTANYIEEEKYRKPNSTEVIWDCVDLEHFKPAQEKFDEVKTKYNLPDREQFFVILTLGRIAKEAAHKGYDRLINVFERLVKQYPNARLVIGGKGNMLSEMKEMVKTKQLNDFITFTGMVHDDDMAALYSYAHVFSLVSDRGKGRGEGIPLTPLEAMACKTPIIVGNQDGSREAIVDNKNGYVIDPFDLDTHFEIFEKLIKDVNHLKKLEQNALTVAHEIFSYQVFEDKHRTFLKKYLN